MATRPMDLLEPLAALGVQSRADVLDLIQALERLVAALGRPRAKRQVPSLPAPALPPAELQTAVVLLQAAVDAAEENRGELMAITERLEQPQGRPLSEALAQVYGRRVAMLLAQGEFGTARLAIAEASAAQPVADPATLYWYETQLDRDLVGRLESLELVRVGDVLNLEDQTILSWKDWGLQRLRLLDTELRRLGLRRKKARLNLVG